MHNKKVIYTSEALQCAHCSNFGTLRICDTALNSEVIQDNAMPGLLYETGDMYSILQCPSCSRINIALSRWNDDMEDESELSYNIIYPEKERIPIGLPASIKQGYEAAIKLKSIDPNAYAVLLRRLLELVCIDRNAQGKDLYNKLSDLAQKGEIPTNLVDVAHGLRDLGNVGAHAGLGEVTGNEIPILRALINAVLEYVYSAPHLAQIAKHASNNIKANKKP